LAKVVAVHTVRWVTLLASLDVAVPANALDFARLARRLTHVTRFTQATRVAAVITISVSVIALFIDVQDAIATGADLLARGITSDEVRWVAGFTWIHTCVTTNDALTLIVARRSVGWVALLRRDCHSISAGALEYLNVYSTDVRREYITGDCHNTRPRSAYKQS
jgi:hypothetical protein